MVLIYSTLSTPTTYNLFKQGHGNVQSIEHSVTLKGGANVAQDDSGKLWTPLGVVTEITDEEFSILKENEVFKLHLANKFLTIRENEKEQDVEKVIGESEMNPRDLSAQKVPEDFPANPVNDTTATVKAKTKK
jgi:hypothetical protein